MLNNGLFGRLYDMPIFELPENLATQRIEKRIEPTRLEEQSSNILFCLFNPPPMCRVEVKEENVAYLFNLRGIFGLNRGIFASKDSIDIITRCIS